jgi:copper chaperone CopZ
MDTKVYRVDGMSCGGCARHVEKALRAVLGVTEVRVQVAEGTAAVTGDAPREALAASLKEAGYDLVDQV